MSHNSGGTAFATASLDMQARFALNDVTRRAERAVHRNRTWLGWCGRAGYFARAVLYFTVGGLATFSAFGMGGKLADPRGALDELYHQPLGAILLVAMTAGFVGYGAWKLLQAFLDPSREANRHFPRLHRFGWFVTALAHFALAAHAVSRLSPSLVRSQNTDARRHAAEALSLGTAGTLLVAGVGIVFVGLAAKELWAAIRGELDRFLDLSRLPPPARHAVTVASRVGIASRGVVFGIIGAYLFLAAVGRDPALAKGFAESLGELRRAPMGGTLLGVVAIGLVAFALYQLLEARYRRILGEH